MKKKWYKKILSVLLCFVCLFFVGCGDGGPDGGNGDDYYQSTLDGVKVLSRPAEYSFSEAVGDFSEYYYNLFSREILNALYANYNDFYLNDDYLKLYISEFTKDIDLVNGETYQTFTYNDDGEVTGTVQNFSVEENKYYLYDSTRYTISKVITTKDSSGNVVGQTLTLDLNSSWNWTLPYNATGSMIVFKNSSYGIEVGLPNNNREIVVDMTNAFGYIDDDWIQIYSETGVTPSFPKVYAGQKVELGGEVDGTKYFTSPYYEKYVENKAEITSQNYYQDALEYVTYLFVLGYDYQDESGDATADAAKFEFVTEYDSSSGKIKDVKVGGVSVVEALKSIKEEYARTGNFVGITNTNKEQIARFIKDKVIGEKAYAKNVFSVDMVGYTKNDGGGTSQDAVQPADLKFNRNYDKIVENIVDYACKQAPIGVDKEGNNVTLDNPFLSSQITDYDGDYFYVVDDENGDIFRYISPAEYQSMVLYPTADDIGKKLTDVHLVFEYRDFDETLAKGLVSDQNGLTINVGLRYFDHTQNAYTFNKSHEITIKYGTDAEISNRYSPDENTVTFSTDNYVGDSVKIEKDIVLNTKFDNEIGEGALDPSKNATGNQQVAVMPILGNNDARKYYAINDSESGVGFYGALNGEMFTEAEAGDHACDFVEVYFDIKKAKGTKNVNYNFKVGLRTYYTED